jgi:hypothetical protein
MEAQQYTYDEERDCWVVPRPEPDVNRQVYGTYEGKLRIEETRDFDLSSGHISEHSACIASLSAAGSLLTNEDLSEAMQKYHELEGYSGL